DGHKDHDAKWQALLVEPTKRAMGFPSGVPGIPDSIFASENFIFPVLDYDWGPDYDHSEANGVPTNAPPAIRHVIKMLVPRVNAACKGYLLAGPAAALMGAKCTSTIPAGFPDDWASLVNAAISSNVCNQPGDGGKCNPVVP